MPASFDCARFSLRARPHRVPNFLSWTRVATTEPALCLLHADPLPATVELRLTAISGGDVTGT